MKYCRNGFAVIILKNAILSTKFLHLKCSIKFLQFHALLNVLWNDVRQIPKCHSLKHVSANRVIISSGDLLGHKTLPESILTYWFLNYIRRGNLNLNGILSNQILYQANAFEYTSYRLTATFLYFSIQKCCVPVEALGCFTIAQKPNKECMLSVCITYQHFLANSCVLFNHSFSVSTRHFAVINFGVKSTGG